MLRAQVTESNNSIVRERYLTISVVKRNIEEARTYFARVGTDLTTKLAALSSVAQELSLNERLRIFRDFFRPADPPAAEFDIHQKARRGQHFKDWLCPSSMEFTADHFKIDDRVGRVLYLQDFASYLKDSFVSELCDLDRELMLSIDILPIPTDEAARQLQNTLLGVETNVTNWQRKQNANNNWSAIVPYDMELQRKETKEMLDDLTTRDQRMMFGLVTLVHMAGTKEQLDDDTESLLSVARKHLCQLSSLRWQQRDGLDTVLPYGLQRIEALRTLTTESTAVLIPFHAQEIMQHKGMYYGQNAVSKNRIVVDRRQLLNGNSFRLGVSGSGKSMSAKEEIAQIALSTEDDILILDVESEFGHLVEAFGGEVIRISATSDTHINALDMDRAYGDERNPIVSKSEFVLSLFEQLIGSGLVTAKEKSILGRCTEQVYMPYVRNGYKGAVPTLKDFYRLLKMQPEPEAQGLALSSELFITGTLGTFAQPTNVDTKAQIIAYDIRELGEQLLVTEKAFNRTGTVGMVPLYADAIHDEHSFALPVTPGKRRHCWCMGVCVLYSNFPYLASTHRRLSCSYTAWMPFGFIRVAGSVFVTCSSNKRSLRFDNGYSFVRSSNFSVGTSKPSRVAFKRQRIESGKTQNVCASSHYVFGLCCSATGASGDGCQLHCDGHLCGSSAFGGCAC